MPTRQPAAQLIRLPSGGGALRGLGETFTPQPFTGAGTLTVPLALPPGRGGLTPSLSLRYATGAGNGPFGLGWSVSVPRVTRRTAHGLPVYDDSVRVPGTSPAARDVFLLADAEELVPVGQPVPSPEDPGLSAQRFRPRTEGLFARIERLRGERVDRWRVSTRDGLVSDYGESPGRPDPAPATVVDPAVPERVFAWALTATTDPFGNTIEYSYLRHGNQLYLDQVRYADVPGEDDRFLASVRFEYEPGPGEERPDAFSDHRAGFELRTGLRCRRIAVRTHADAARLVRTYDLDYGTDPGNGQSLLTRVQVTGHDGGETEMLPPLDLSYTVFDPGRDHRLIPLTGPDLPGGAPLGPGADLVDLSGDALPDLVQTGDLARAWRNLGGGAFARSRYLAHVPPGVDLAAPTAQVLDADGDGRAEVMLLLADQAAGYVRLDGAGSQDGAGGGDSGGLVRYGISPSFRLDDPEVRLLDLDADGSTDVLRTGTRLQCFFNDRDPALAWRRTLSLQRLDAEHFPDVSFADPCVKLADMNGDGLTDVVLVHAGSVEYWPSLGHGRWGGRRRMAGGPLLPLDWDPARLLLGDVDGDGVADLIYVDDGRTTLWVNHSGNRWGAPTEILGTPRVTDASTLRLADVLGSGTSAVVFSRAADGLGPHLHALTLAGTARPHLLAQVDNNLGARTRIDYRPSTDFFLEDEHRPTTRWRTSLPFPVPVVASVTVEDRISGGRLDTSFDYHHGHWDAEEREFRGFGLVDQRDAELTTAGPHQDPEHLSPPVLTRVWYHLGALGRAGAAGAPDLQESHWPADPAVLSPLGHDDATEQLLAALPARARRDALRALRGTTLRTEVFALDATARSDRPYSVTETCTRVCVVSDRMGDAGEEGILLGAGPALAELVAETAAEPLVYFPAVVAQRTTQWERGEDPMTVFTFTDAYDGLGRSHRSSVVAMPRRLRARRPVGRQSGRAVAVDEDGVLAQHARTEYATPAPDTDGRRRYLHDRVAERRSYEPVEPPGFREARPDDLLALLRDQAEAARALHDRLCAVPAPADARLTGHTVHHYDGEPYRGLDEASVVRGALTRSESLVLTERELAEIFAGRAAPHRPASLGGASADTPSVVDLAVLGYRRHDTDDGRHVAGYYADTDRRCYDVQARDEPPDGWTRWPARGVLVGVQDGLGHPPVRLVPDRYWLLTQATTDPAGLVTTMRYDYRLFQPSAISDPNGAVTRVRYGPLGLPRATWVEGASAGDTRGGSEAAPDAEHAYDLLAFARSRDEASPQPAWVHTTVRSWAGSGATMLVQDSRQYVDGLGRTVQRRSSAEEVVYGPGAAGLPTDVTAPPLAARAREHPDRVVVDGRQVHDNKGRPVEKYPPRFSRGFGYETAGDDPARRVSLRYDPRGHLVRTLNADGSQQRVCFGRPGPQGRLALEPGAEAPPGFEPTAWELLTYDANDLAATSTDPRTGASLAGRAPPAHHGTAQTRVLDAWGRVRAQVDRLGRSSKDWLVTTFGYDGSGNPLGCRDPWGRESWSRRYDLLGRPWRVRALDAGPRTMVLNALGDLVRFRDAAGAVVEHEYDDANRLVRVWAALRADAERHLHERLEYGRASARADLRGRLVAHRDGAGLLRILRYDLRGNVSARVRRVVSDAVLAGVAAEADWVPAWERPDADAVLDATPYREDTVFDTAGRPRRVTAPAMADGHRPVLAAAYGRGGLLASLHLDSAVVVGHHGYDPEGHRVLVDHGNGLLTRFAHDLRTSQLARCRTERCRFDAATSSYLPESPPIRDTGYRYDLVGNVTALLERTAGSGVPGNPEADTHPDPELGNLLRSGDALVRRFDYDPLYRLTSATGRSLRLPRSFADVPGLGAYRPPDAPGEVAVQAYRETYRYDAVGNLRALRYVAGEDRWVRRIGLGGLAPDVEVTPSDTATSVTAGAERRRYGYDAEGRLRTQGPTIEHRWDPWGRLLSSRLAAERGPGTSVRHLHDAQGRRVKTWWHTGDRVPRSTTYLFGSLQDRRWTTPDGTPRRSTMFVVSDGPFPLLQVRRGDAQDTALPATTHHLADHLGSHTLVTDDAAVPVAHEEYFPWGETSLGGRPGTAFRFTGKERDGRTGLYHGDSRWYLPELGRWSGPDPRGPVDGLCLYSYARNNPVTRVDETGGQSRPATVQLPADLNAPEMARAAAQFRENPLSWQGIKSLLFGFAWTYSGRPQDAQGRPLTAAESHRKATNTMSLATLYALGLGQNTAKWLNGNPYDASAIKGERLSNSLALLGVATRGLRLFGVARGLMTENRVFALNQAMGSPLAGASHPNILLNPSRETLLAMAEQERHILQVTHLPSGTSFWVVSGPGGQLGHTEYAAARYLQAQGKLNAGDSLLLQGYLAACNPKGAGAVCCHHLLDYLARTKGMDVLYEAESLAADLGRVSGGSRYYEPGAGHILQSTGEPAAAPNVASQILTDFSGQ